MISVASLWERSIKVQNGKLELQKDWKELIQSCSEKEIAILPITVDNVLILHTLDLHHRDPFDRIIISQAICEDLTLITKDPEFKSYPVKLRCK